MLAEEGYLKVGRNPRTEEKDPERAGSGRVYRGDDQTEDMPESPSEQSSDRALFEAVKTLKKGMTLPIRTLEIREGETSPPEAV